MPFCTNCGNSVEANAAYCVHCGKPQPRPAAPASDLLASISDRTASILCYIPVFGIIPAIVFLAAHRFRNNATVRFNGFQALYLFVTWLVVSSAVPTLIIGLPGWGMEHLLVGLLKVAIFVCWIYLLVKAANHEQVRLPILGDLAARSTMEQL